jgi:hypothetical protein
MVSGAWREGTRGVSSGIDIDILLRQRAGWWLKATQRRSLAAKRVVSAS